MKNRRFSALFACLALILSPPSFANSIRVSGSTSAQSAISLLAESFQEQYDIRLLMRPIGSDKGIKSVVNGKSELGVISRSLTSAEQNQFKTLKQVTLAHDALVILVNTANPITNLSTTELSDIYTGKIDKWIELEKLGSKQSLPNFPIVVYSKDSSHGTFDVFTKSLLLENAVKNKAIYFRKYGEEFSDKGAKSYRRVNGAIAAVCRSKHGIAFDSYASIKNADLKTSCLEEVKVVAINSLLPNDPSYFFVRPINVIYDSGAVSEGTQRFLKFMNNKESQQKLRQNFYLAFPK
ncbi:substrate-binding domain-containing protein [Vibrio marisflavi]|uniref:Phosphate-binding protein PstS n=1 Tax=Vibrio marisflavi CECT 7928 TaxID=634439 RepID=A0ABM9A105_9VIBR|nr:substrate-binding domain-containing protein [Vibrio marisflavi]CAH0537355.1 Phosphate-binding protein PstS [Vibrio marisflavi CECT 7928]